ncbi:cyclic AMP-dependent transcription factor ATF-1 [Hypanus sabinus]|uniref:cyclic AMP-dependent transcription factor ATF-1 n=1 Tax=Hypanus sabinus TaxID=79690 RepID=UPI0028C4AAB4|nr:cyclic AMP-dependent transcription factor ATF-1 [Hypanus sabinus]
MEEVQRDEHNSTDTETSNPTTLKHEDIEETQKESVQSESKDVQEPSNDVSSSQESHELLTNCTSYRKMLEDLSPGDVTTKEDDRGNKEADGTPLTTLTVPAPLYQTNTGQYIALTPGGGIQLASVGAEGVRGLQALTTSSAGAVQQGPTFLQYAQTTDGQQILVPSNQVVLQTALGDVPTYQIQTTPSTNALSQTVMMTSPITFQTHAGKTEDATLKRAIRLMKNREAARECRRKKKEYVKCLENRVAVLENQNKTLTDELKALKDHYCHKTA